MKNLLKLLALGAMLFACYSCSYLDQFKEKDKDPVPIETVEEITFPPTVDDILEFRRQEIERIYLENVFLNIPDDVLRVIYESISTLENNTTVAAYYLSKEEFHKGVEVGIGYEQNKHPNVTNNTVPEARPKEDPGR